VNGNNPFFSEISVWCLYGISIRSGDRGVVDRETKLRRLKCRRDQIKVESAIEPIGVVFLFAPFGLLLGVAVYILGESNGGLLISGLSALALGGYCTPIL